MVTKSELTGSLDVYAERLAADRELFEQLDLKQLEELAAESQALVDKAMAMVAAQRVPPARMLARAPVGDETIAAPAEKPTDIEVGDGD